MRNSAGMPICQFCGTTLDPIRGFCPRCNANYTIDKNGNATPSECPSSYLYR